MSLSNVVVTACAFLLLVLGILGLAAGVLAPWHDPDQFRVMLTGGLGEAQIAKYWKPEFLASIRFTLILISSFFLLASCASLYWRQRLLAGAHGLGMRARRLFGFVRCASDPLDVAGGLFLLSTGFAVLVYAAITLPLTGDEAVMYTSVCSSHAPVWVAAYIAPNNHVGLSGLIWVGHFFWGDSETGMRCFSLIAWALSALVLSQISVQLIRSYCASLVALVMTLPWVLAYGMLARGYCLGSLLVYLTILGALRANDRRDLALSGAVAGLAIWIVPTMVYGAVLAAAIAAWRQRAIPRRAVWGAAILIMSAFFLATLLYAPILLVSGWQNLLRNKYVTQLSWTESAHSYPHWLATTLYGLFAYPGALVVLLVALISRTIGRRPAVPAIFALLTLTVFLLPFFQRVTPFTRVVLWIAPLLLLLIGGVGNAWVSRIYAGLALCAAFLVLGYGRNALLSVPAGWATLARPAAAELANAQAALVQTRWHGDDYGALRFYLRHYRHDVPIEATPEYTGEWVFDSDPEDVDRTLYDPVLAGGLYKRKAIAKRVIGEP